MRTTLDLPDNLFRELKAQAALRGMTMKDLLAELLERGLRSSGTVSRQRSQLPVVRRATGIATPAMSNAELAQILDEEDASQHAQPAA